LQRFILHQFVMRWQAEQYKVCLDNFPLGAVIIAIDFAENHTFLYKLEVQSLHWTPHQSTVLVAVIYRWADLAVDDIPDEDNNQSVDGSSAPAAQRRRVIIKEHHFFVTDDLKHDQAMVKHCIKKYLMSTYAWGAQDDSGTCFAKGAEASCAAGGAAAPKLQAPSLVIIWSDGAASQFKSKEGFYKEASLSMQLRVPVVHNFFCSGHGKGEHDGAGANLKHAAAMFNVTATDIKFQLKNAADLVNWATVEYSEVKGSTYKYRNDAITLAGRRYHYIAPDEVPHEPVNVKAVPGVRSHHQFIFKPEFEGEALLMRRFGCCCEFCYQQEWSKCINQKHAATPVLRKLQLGGREKIVTRQVAGRMGEELAELINPADQSKPADAHCMFVTDDHEHDYYLMKATIGQHILHEDKTDGYKMTYPAGSSVVAGHYYDRYPPGISDNAWKKKLLNRRAYYLDKSKLAYQYTHLVGAVQFELVRLGKGLDQPVPGCPKIKKAKHLTYIVPLELENTFLEAAGQV